MVSVATADSLWTAHHDGQIIMDQSPSQDKWLCPADRIPLHAHPHCRRCHCLLGTEHTFPEASDHLCGICRKHPAGLHPLPLLRLRACPHCHGDLYREIAVGGFETVCLQCGHRT